MVATTASNAPSFAACPGWCSSLPCQAHIAGKVNRSGAWKEDKRQTLHTRPIATELATEACTDWMSTTWTNHGVFLHRWRGGGSIGAAAGGWWRMGCWGLGRANPRFLPLRCGSERHRWERDRALGSSTHTDSTGSQCSSAFEGSGQAPSASAGLATGSSAAASSATVRDEREKRNGRRGRLSVHQFHSSVRMSNTEARTDGWGPNVGSNGPQDDPAKCRQKKNS